MTKTHTPKDNNQADKQINTLHDDPNLPPLLIDTEMSSKHEEDEGKLSISQRTKRFFRGSIDAMDRGYLKLRRKTNDILNI